MSDETLREAVDRLADDMVRDDRRLTVWADQLRALSATHGGGPA